MRDALRLFKESDTEEVSEICSDVYGGNDYVPSCLKQLSISVKKFSENSERERLLRGLEMLPRVPLVLESVDESGEPKVVAFGWVQRDTNGPSSMWMVEAIRVSPAFRSKGVGTCLIDKISSLFLKQGILCRLVATTLSSNIAMSKIFEEKCGYMVQGYFRVWPGSAVQGLYHEQRLSSTVRTINGRDLQAPLNLLDFLEARSSFAEASHQQIYHWHRKSSPDTIASMLAALKSKYGVSGFIPQYFKVTDNILKDDHIDVFINTHLDALLYIYIDGKSTRKNPVLCVTGAPQTVAIAAESAMLLAEREFQYQTFELSIEFVNDKYLEESKIFSAYSGFPKPPDAVVIYQRDIFPSE